MLGPGDPPAPWVDITSQVDAACASLAKGQMVHQDNFSLFDSMSAIEIGCPKMDVGFISGAEPSVEDRIESGEAPLNLDLTQVLAITDRLLAAMASYFRGDPLAQTVYTSLYAMRPDRNASVPTLHAIVQLVTAVCKLVMRVGEASGVLMEDEISLRDAVPGGPSTPTVEQAMHRARQVEADLRTLTRPRGGGGSKKSKKGAGDEPSPSPVDSQLASALLKRIDFLKAMLQGLELYEPGKKSGMSGALEHFRAASQLIREAAESSSLAEGVEAPGFVPDLVPKRALPMPRHVTVMSVPEMFRALQRLADDLAWSTAHLTKCATWEALRDMLFAFGRRATGPVARSLLYNALAKKDRLKTELATEAPWTVTRGLVAREFGLADADVADLPALQSFFEQAETILQTWQQLMCLERSRQHRKVRRYLEDWTVLYKVAQEASDSPDVLRLLEKKGWRFENPELRRPVSPLCLFVEHMTARVQADNLLSGFDLDLYQPREYLMIFWYLDYLLALGAELVKTWSLLHPHGGLRAPKREPARVLRYLRQAVPLEVLRFICQAYTRTLVAMRQEGRFLERELPFNTTAEAFDLRFCHLHLNQAPQPLWFEDFKATTAADDVTPKQLYLLAVESFAQASQVCDTFRLQHGAAATPEELEELDALNRVAVQNKTAATLLGHMCAAAEGKPGAAAPTLHVNWETQPHVHAQLPVIALRTAPKKT